MMRHRWLLFYVLVISTSLLLFSSSTLAQSPAEIKALADKRFDEGKVLQQQGRIDEACEKFEESYRLLPRGGTVLNLGLCHKQQGKLVAAWAELSEAVTFAKRDGRSDREKLAQDTISEIEPLLAWVSIKVDSATAAFQGLEVKRDSDVVPTNVWGSFVPLDPGAHTISASAVDAAPWQRRIVLKPGQRREVLVSLSPMSTIVVADDNGTRPPDDGTTYSDRSVRSKRNIVGAFASIDTLIGSGRDGVCSGKDAAGNVNDGVFACFYTGEDPNRTGQFYGVPNEQPGTDSLSAELRLGGARFGAQYDRQILEAVSLTVGLRLGFAISARPESSVPPTSTQAQFGHSQSASFFPFHGELRIGYSFIGKPFEAHRLSPYIFVAGGLAGMAAGATVAVCDTKDEAGNNIPSNVTVGGCPNGSVFQNVNAFQAAGNGFVGIGPGITYGITEHFGLQLEVKVMFMVPNFAVAFSPTLSPVFAF